MVVQNKFVPGVLIVTGDRYWGPWGYEDPKHPTLEETERSDDQYARIERFLRDFKFRHSVVYLIVSDVAVGADHMAAVAARKMGYQISVYKSDPKLFKDGAESRRSAAMLARGLDWRSSGANVEVAVFHDDIERSNVAKDCVKQAMDAGIRVNHG